MTKKSHSSWTFFLAVFLNNYVICALVGLFILGTFRAHENDFNLLHPTFFQRCIVAVINGLMVMLVVWLFYVVLDWHKQKHLNREHYTERMWRMRKRIAMLVGFVAGTSNVIFFLSGWSVFLQTLLILILAFVHLKKFARTVVRLLRPGNYPTWPDIGEMMHVYMTILAAFTMITISLGLLHHYIPAFTPAFSISENPRFIIDAFYFNVVVMTTLGFGDITPLTAEARLWISFECLISYFMFGLLIGTITKGIVSSPENGDAVSNKERMETDSA